MQTEGRAVVSVVLVALLARHAAPATNSPEARRHAKRTKSGPASGIVGGPAHRAPVEVTLDGQTAPTSPLLGPPAAAPLSDDRTTGADGVAPAPGPSADSGPLRRRPRSPALTVSPSLQRHGRTGTRWDRHPCPFRRYRFEPNAISDGRHDGDLGRGPVAGRSLCPDNGSRTATSVGLVDARPVSYSSTTGTFAYHCAAHGAPRDRIPAPLPLFRPRTDERGRLGSVTRPRTAFSPRLDLDPARPRAPAPSLRHPSRAARRDPPSRNRGGSCAPKSRRLRPPPRTAAHSARRQNGAAQPGASRSPRRGCNPAASVP